MFDAPRTTYSDTTAQRRVISDAIFLIDPVSTPVVARLGLNSARQKFRIALDGKKVEILEDAYAPTSGTFNNSTTVTTTTLSITVTDASKLVPGMIIKFDSELAVVSSVNVTTNVIVLQSRTYGGTRATHTATVAFTIVGMARLEAATATYNSMNTLTNPFNYTSIFQKGIQVSRTDRAIAYYGMADPYTYEVNKSVPELTRWLELAFFNSIRQVGTASASRSMGGIGTFLSSNSSSITTTITKASLDSLALKIYNAGGQADVFICNPQAANNLRNLIDSSSFVRVGQENTMYGMMDIQRINTQFYQNIEILASRFCPLKKAYLLDSNKVGFYELRPFAEEAIAHTGDFDASEVVGEFSMLLANEAGHGWIQTSATGL